MNKITVAVLGANGLVGHTVFSFLKSQSVRTIGTDRTDKNYFIFNALDPVRSLKRLYAEYPSIDYIINCIGILKPLMEKVPLEESLFINGIFPHILATETIKQKTRLIHVSTDAVFDEMSGTVNEDAPAHPSERYGMSKLLGEPIAGNTLTIRTSIIGRDPIHKRGLVEWVENLTEETTITGYARQQWSGCTSNQFAQLCNSLIRSDRFESIVKATNKIHFAPIISTKYDLIVTLAKQAGKRISVVKSETPIVTRILTTKFAQKIGMDTFSNKLIIS